MFSLFMLAGFVVLSVVAAAGLIASAQAEVEHRLPSIDGMKID